VNHDIVIRPFDRITDMSGNLRRREGDLRHLNLDYGGVRAAKRVTPAADKVRPIGAPVISVLQLRAQRVADRFVWAHLLSSL